MHPRLLWRALAVCERAQAFALADDVMQRAHKAACRVRCWLCAIVAPAGALLRKHARLDLLQALVRLHLAVKDAWLQKEL